MKLCTTSETISFIKDMEEKCIRFYEALSPIIKEFAQFPKENKNFITQIQRTYQSVITDAIEGCYAFDLEADDYPLDVSVDTGWDRLSTLKKALDVERCMHRLYETAATQSMALMADVPRMLKLIAKKREGRIRFLEGLINP